MVVSVLMFDLLRVMSLLPDSSIRMKLEVTEDNLLELADNERFEYLKSLNYDYEINGTIPRNMVLNDLQYYNIF